MNLSLVLKGWFKIPQINRGNDDFCFQAKRKKDNSGDDSGEAAVSLANKPLKGILKYPSSDSLPQLSSSPSKLKVQRANSKGHNVFHLWLIMLYLCVSIARNKSLGLIEIDVDFKIRNLVFNFYKNIEDGAIVDLRNYFVRSIR